MKTMTCRKLGGVCNKSFEANTFEEMADKSMQHGKEMAQKNDGPHLNAMQKMQSKTKEEMKAWYQQKKEEFEALPSNDERLF